MYSNEVILLVIALLGNTDCIGADGEGCASFKKTHMQKKRAIQKQEEKACAKEGRNRPMHANFSCRLVGCIWQYMRKTASIVLNPWQRGFILVKNIYLLEQLIKQAMTCEKQLSGNLLDLVNPDWVEIVKDLYMHSILQRSMDYTDDSFLLAIGRKRAAIQSISVCSIYQRHWYGPECEEIERKPTVNENMPFMVDRIENPMVKVFAALVRQSYAASMNGAGKPQKWLRKSQAESDDLITKPYPEATLWL
ncbi:hypothetical protein CHS0354_041512, partial [Potamilus streckersoni]